MVQRIRTGVDVVMSNWVFHVASPRPLMVAALLSLVGCADIATNDLDAGPTSRHADDAGTGPTAEDQRSGSDSPVELEDVGPAAPGAAPVQSPIDPCDGCAGAGGSPDASGAGGSSGAAGMPGRGTGGGLVGPVGQGGSAAEPDSECVPGDAFCEEGNQLWSCSSAGRWEISPCPFLCVEDETECTGVCSPDDERCRAGQLEACNEGGQWEVLATCSEGCADEGSCAVPDDCGHFLQGCCSGATDGCQAHLTCETECVFGITCDAFGSCVCLDNVSESTCVHAECEDDADCASGASCVASAEGSVCLMPCSGPGSGQGDCPDGNVCTSAEQGGGVCLTNCNLPGLACLDSVCNAAGYCVECAVGTTRCSDNVVETCGTDNTWEAMETCPSACYEGTCSECAPGWSCDGSSMTLCSDDGSPSGAQIACTNSCNDSLGRCNNALEGDCERLYPCCSVLGIYATGCRNVANAGNDSTCYNWLQERWTQDECQGYATTGLEAPAGCSVVGCQNGGNCVESALGPACECPQGYSGTYCEIEGADCAPGDFQCDDGECIPGAWECDGTVDCSSLEDELECGDDPCLSTDFQCNDGYCISELWLCDGILDCLGGEDELDCAVACTADEFMCAEGVCIDAAAECDGINDCTGGEDELDCPDNETETCQDVTCPANATCEDGSGVPTCVCDTGYAGANCDVCAAAYRWSQASCVEAPPEIYALWPMPNPPSTGLPNPASYTVDAVAGVVLDDVTGLMWQRDVPAAAYNWDNARAHCDALSLGGYTDWRLPTRIELVSLVDFTAFPGNTPAAFPAGLGMWTDSQRALPGDDADTKLTLFGDYLHASNTAAVQCVRSANSPAPPSSRYSVQGLTPDDTVLDVSTGLTWRGTPSVLTLTHSQAAAHCTALGANWRLPSVKELQTLVDETTSPAIDAVVFHFSEYQAWSAWSSTAFGGDDTRSWSVSFYFGTASHENEGVANHAYCVQ